ncbi:MAG: ATP-binding protein [Pseudomonadota bacterium]
MKPTATSYGDVGSGNLVPRVTIICLLLFIYAAVGLCLNIIWETSVIYTHLAYIPIVLSAVWWGRKSLIVAAALAALLLLFNLLHVSSAALPNDLARCGFFVLAALFAGGMSEKILLAGNAIAVSEEKYRLLIENALTMTFVYREDFRIIYANPRFFKVLAYHEKDLAEIDIWDIIFKEDAGTVKELISARRENPLADLRYECRYVRRDGRVLWMDVASGAIDFREEKAVLVNAYDITSKKEAEIERERLASLARKQEEQLVHSTRLAELGEMAAAVAHELNQPLTGIRNFARNAFFMLDRDAGSTDDVKDNLNHISIQVDRASRIINQMRGLARKSEREFAAVRINEVIRESIDFLGEQLKVAGIEARVELSDDVPVILGDRINLEQVMLNIITNARQAMEESEERRLSVASTHQAGTRLPVVIEICDTGKGFDGSTAGKVFTPFFSTKKPGHGTGLGLSISLTIIESHGGTIEARGEPGKGAAFTIRLPSAHEQPESDAREKSNEQRKK